MFSSVGNIFVNRPREAESTDARLDIRRHDPDHERRKKKEEQEPDLNMEISDSATISIDALQTFLETFLKSLEKKNVSGRFQTLAHKQEYPAQTEFSLNPPPKRPSGDAARAANLYQTVAKVNEKSSLISINDQDEAPEISLASSDVRLIHTLMEDLKFLRKHGASTITIEKNESFLAALVAAAAKKKALLGT